MSKKEPMQVFAPDPTAKPSPSKYVGGSIYEKFNYLVTNQAINAQWISSTCEDADRQKLYEATLEAMAGIAPRDEIEGMLAAQMVACHSMSMECFRRAMLPGQTFEGRQQNLNYANKLSRTYALHMEALDKHRGKGQQKVTVEHVHVRQGGQAIVGSVHSGVGMPGESENQAHGQVITDAREPEMRSAFEAKRESVSRTSDEER